MKKVIGRLNNKQIVAGNNAKNYADGRTQYVKEGNKIFEKKNGVWVEPFSPVANPIIEPTGGEVTTETDIAITCSTGGTIYYTTDDSSPKTSDTRVKYTAPFNIADACTVKAVAYDGDEYSEVVYAVFTIESTVEETTPTEDNPQTEETTNP